MKHVAVITTLVCHDSPVSLVIKLHMHSPGFSQRISFRFPHLASRD